MKRLVCSLFAVAFAVSFGACEGHSVAELPAHYQHKMHHGDHHEDVEHKDGAKHEGGAKHTPAEKDPNQKHRVEVEAQPAAKPAEAPHK